MTALISLVNGLTLKDKNLCEKLPSEILRHVFKIIYEDGLNDRAEMLEDLYTCIQVNKRWCETAMPILWSNIIPSASVINVYMSFFTPDERNELISKGIPFQKISTKSSLTFCYPSFLRVLNLHEFSSAIFHWCLQECRQPISIQYNILLRGLLVILARHCKTLQQLHLDRRLLLDNMHHELWLLLHESTTRNLITSVRKLCLDVRKIINEDCLRLLCESCRHLRILKVDMTLVEPFWSWDSRIAQLISSQKYLCSFIMKRGKCTDALISALESHTSSLRLIHFRRVDFSKCTSIGTFKSDCKNLEVLIIHGCKYLSGNVREELINASFPKLIELDVNGTDFDGAMVSWNNCVGRRNENQELKFY
ncbi:E3 ubiquitin-protein ligase RAD18 [Gigaspora margarita]|uniref:E3 ubiquitin-protein ligase RAD18 n=1 Tax=Gigaspora margarita TaxID=4874 RepID=A0A8H3XID7_GIGMA|nr:E3 ubiquitin-protein ligase RAD18 [Gigaspora margarita]